MADDLDFGVEIRVAPIVRDPDGLAMSSRNAYLSAEERPEALLLHESLRRARSLIEDGERDAERLRTEMRNVLARGAALQVDYVDIVETTTLRALRTLHGRILLAVAAVIGSTRLIDNVVLEVGDAGACEVSLDAARPQVKPGRTNATT